MVCVLKYFCINVQNIFSKIFIKMKLSSFPFALGPWPFANNICAKRSCLFSPILPRL